MNTALITDEEKPKIDDSVNRTILDNGLRIVSEKIPCVRSASIGLWIRAGSCNETSDTNGIAHFLEHMLFKGTKNRSAKEIAQSLESLGGGLNASTGKEISFYSAYILEEDIEIAVDVLSDMLYNSLFEKKDIELQLRDAEKRLRDIRMQKRQRVEKLKEKMRFYCTVPGPICVLVIAVGLGIYRSYKRRRYISHVSDS